MPKIIDLIGQKFGRLTVLSYDGLSIKGNFSYWLCKCECGKIVRVRGISLTNKLIVSCGCYKRDRMLNLNKLKYGISSKKYIYYDYKSRSKKKDRVFELPFEEFVNLAQQNCFYCGSKPNNVKKSEHNNGDFIYNEIDRLNNTKGYTIENCVPCCKICNGAKSKMSYEEFMLWIKTLVDYRNLINSTNGGY